MTGARLVMHACSTVLVFGTLSRRLQVFISIMFVKKYTPHAFCGMIPVEHIWHTQLGVGDTLQGEPERRAGAGRVAGRGRGGGARPRALGLGAGAAMGIWPIMAHAPRTRSLLSI